jgi:nucleotide-binding universal stress UspA family protein
MGTPVGVILKVAADRACDLIVMGAREMCYGQPSAPLTWVRLHHVICGAQCPVLTIHG